MMPLFQSINLFSGIAKTILIIQVGILSHRLVPVPAGMTGKPPVVSRTSSPEKALLATAGWQYEDKSDNIAGTVYKATLNSDNLVQFPYPYAGGSTVSLVIRTRNGTTNVYLATSKALFTRSFQGGKAQLRFDGGRPITYSLTAAANGGGNTIFFDAEKKLIQQLKASKALVVQVRLMELSLNDLRFNTAGLRWNH